MPTVYHAALWAHQLSVAGRAGDISSLSRAIGSAKVHLNPHQVDAALFAIQSPFSKGVILADEVGLGKTIEAGIVMTQAWAERRRKLLLVVPATLRAQWQGELREKFGLPSMILDGPAVKAERPHNAFAPKHPQVIICSYDLVGRNADLVGQIAWDLVVIDEAHRLRNVYSNKHGRAATLRDATQDARKLLLTATPLQNSLNELYGLVSVIDDQVFGDIKTFRDQFVKPGADEARNQFLRERLQPLVARTLRRQVTGFVNFTRRHALTADFTPNDDEQAIYDEVTAYLKIPELNALPSGQRPLITIVLRKLLASSTFAVAKTLRGLAARLQTKGASKSSSASFGESLTDYEATDEELYDGDDAPLDGGDSVATLSLEDEYRLLARLADKAEAIEINAKGEQLVQFLPEAFAKTEERGGARKAVIFTESRRTQQYLFRRLGEAGYEGQIVCINGDNRDFGSPEIYRRWLERHRGSDRISGAKAADLKAALVEEFARSGTLLIATESAAEGVNLQFASLLINYDLPWNPQRVEQRIGRVHRYGQKHDVFVLNFINSANAADKRVHELLSQKFQLFEGVFGASDEVLGALESGVDLEKRIAQIYQEARSATEIERYFDALREELDEKIQSRMLDTRSAVLDHLDDEVARRLNVHRDRSRQALNERQEQLLSLTKFTLKADAAFEAEQPAFRYEGPLAPAGNYHLQWEEADALDYHFYHEGHALAEKIIDASTGKLPVGELTLDYTRSPDKISQLEAYVGRSGWLVCTRFAIRSASTDEYVLLAGCDDAGKLLDAELVANLLKVSVATARESSQQPPAALVAAQELLVADELEQAQQRNNQHFDAEVEKLERWTKDLKYGLEAELRQLDLDIDEARKNARRVVSLEAKIEMQAQVSALMKQRAQKRANIHEAGDKLEEQRDTLITRAMEQLRQEKSEEVVWKVRWHLI